MTSAGCVYSVHYNALTDTHTVRVPSGVGLTLREVVIPTLSTPILDADDIILKSEYDVRDGDASAVFGCGKNLRRLREAAVVGVTPGSSTGPGPNPITKYTYEVCTMGYDIECANGESVDSLPLPCDPITCASICCSCGLSKSYRVGGDDSSGISVPYPDSRSLCVAMHADIRSHCPVWLVGYNSFAFDNLFMSFHDPTSSYIKVHSKNRSVSCLCLYEVGINNVDLHLILDTSYRGRFESLRLDMVAGDLGLGKKLRMPSSESCRDDMAPLVKYNLIDSRLTVRVFHALGIGPQILSKCNVMKSCFLDVVRGATGMMCACMLSSYAVSQGKLLDWSKTKYVPDVYEGGRVYEPEVGYYPRVAVVDFKSMYPYIMLCASISHDNVTHYEDVKNSEHGVEWGEDSVVVKLLDATVRFDHNEKCIASQVINTLVEYREIYGKNDEVASASIKAATNSLYGSLGYVDSPVYSPRASRCVTAVGRWLLDRARATFERAGLNVIYGDTDSLFICDPNDNRDCEILVSHVRGALDAFHRGLKGTPFERMSLRLEPPKGAGSSAYAGIVLLGKKMYVLISPTGETKPRGIAICRKDRLGIVIDTYNKCMKVIALYGANDVAAYFIAKVLIRATGRVRANSCMLEEVSCKKRVSGNSCFVYRSADRRDVVIEETDSNARLIVDYNKSYVLDNITTALQPALLACKLGTIKEVMSRFVMF